ncbi:MAG: hypothetical protein DDT19_01546 [Syntrophomonadaceae bacterium]|nr:hypothetical protein [Bacillota bacterium]
MEVLTLVQNDRRPVVRLRLTDSHTGGLLDLSSPVTTVRAMLRAAGSTILKETIPMTKPNGGIDGVVEIPWSAVSLDTAGDFEVEVEINFNGITHTVYDVISLKIRPQFG